MEVKIVEKEAFQLVGLAIKTKGDGDPSTNDISKLWDRFDAASSQIEHSIKPEIKFGLMTFPDHWKHGEPFQYMAGVEVNQFESLPEDMESAELPKQQYAVIHYRGKISGIGVAYDYFYREWLPKSGYEFGNNFEMEYYDGKFYGRDNPESEISFYFPVK
ncbi:MAG TPA: GyrI-like domain-containing protein [Bacillales bacterium]|nr:GyrI-like domain-containing protein [Bacillales bacterium]